MYQVCLGCLTGHDDMNQHRKYTKSTKVWPTVQPLSLDDDLFGPCDKLNFLLGVSLSVPNPLETTLLVPYAIQYTSIHPLTQRISPRHHIPGKTCEQHENEKIKSFSEVSNYNCRSAYHVFGVAEIKCYSN